MNEPKPPLHERSPPSENDSTPGKLAIQFDAHEFAHFLDDIDMSEAQKLEYIETIWTIILHFIDMGFGIHPLQQACGQFSEAASLCGATDSEMVKSPHPHFCDHFEGAGECLCIEGIPAKTEGETP